MPHHAACREDKVTTKLRVVFKAPSHKESCASLNTVCWLDWTEPKPKSVGCNNKRAHEAVWKQAAYYSGSTKRILSPVHAMCMKPVQLPQQQRISCLSPLWSYASGWQIQHNWEPSGQKAEWNTQQRQTPVETYWRCWLWCEAQKGMTLCLIYSKGTGGHLKRLREHKAKCIIDISSYLWPHHFPDSIYHMGEMSVPRTVGEENWLGWGVTSRFDWKMGSEMWRAATAPPTGLSKVVWSGNSAKLSNGMSSAMQAKRHTVLQCTCKEITRKEKL